MVAMLSKEQQEFIMRIYMSYINNGTNSLNFDDVKDIYSSRTAFKRAAKHLIDSKYIYTQRLKSNRINYSLTITGELLARILCNLADLPDEVRRLKWKLLW